MLIVLSPAKSLDYDTPPTTDLHTTPAFVPRSAELIEVLKTKSPAEIGSLMGISDQLSVLNVNRYASWSRKFTTKNAKQAVLAFNGDVYEGLDAGSLKARQLDYLQNHVRILSGLYGMLRPLDLMQPYRLEMGTKLANPGGKDLYAFWGDEITEALNDELAAQKTPVLVNLASEEYFKVVKPKLLKAQVISPVFEDWKGGKYKIISFYAKRARGLMARYAAEKKISQPEKLKAFDVEGYAFAPEASSESSWVFRRKLEG
ncbi:peroxide stress protein YaaA [Herbaspirillum huttiense]|uniref:peroxide stress protein YaaA n=1 Tax=Herbaspirillum huttiense TaxID=863372 RepID=UPI0031D7DC0C